MSSDKVPECTQVKEEIHHVRGGKFAARNLAIFFCNICRAHRASLSAHAQFKICHRLAALATVIHTQVSQITPTLDTNLHDNTKERRIRIAIALILISHFFFWSGVTTNSNGSQVATQHEGQKPDWRSKKSDF